MQEDTVRKKELRGKKRRERKRREDRGPTSSPPREDLDVLHSIEQQPQKNRKKVEQSVQIEN